MGNTNTRRLNEDILDAIQEAVSDAINSGCSAEQIRRSVIYGVLDAMDYAPAGEFANKIVNREYR
jgi:hypothetical protein